MRILVIADVHGEISALTKMIAKLEMENFDVVVCPGDFSDTNNIPEGYSQLDISEIVVQKLLSLKKPVLCVPGNHDPYEILDVFDEYGVNLHGAAKKIMGMEFVGFGGALTPFNTPFEPTEEEITACLKKFKAGGKGIVFVTHSPPFGTKLDMVSSGAHTGSKAIRDFITERQPILAVSAHIHESAGTDKLGSATLFYPGAAFEGFYGIAEIGKEVKCETRRITLSP